MSHTQKTKPFTVEMEISFPAQQMIDFYTEYFPEYSNSPSQDFLRDFPVRKQRGDKEIKFTQSLNFSAENRKKILSAIPQWIEEARLATPVCKSLQEKLQCLPEEDEVSVRISSSEFKLLNKKFKSLFSEKEKTSFQNIRYFTQNAILDRLVGPVEDTETKEDKDVKVKIKENITQQLSEKGYGPEGIPVSKENRDFSQTDVENYCKVGDEPFNYECFGFMTNQVTWLTFSTLGLFTVPLLLEIFNADKFTANNNGRKPKEIYGERAFFFEPSSEVEGAYDFKPVFLPMEYVIDGQSYWGFVEMEPIILTRSPSSPIGFETVSDARFFCKLELPSCENGKRVDDKRVEEIKGIISKSTRDRLLMREIKKFDIVISDDRTSVKKSMGMGLLAGVIVLGLALTALAVASIFTGAVPAMGALLVLTISKIPVWSAMPALLTLSSFIGGLVGLRRQKTSVKVQPALTTTTRQALNASPLSPEEKLWGATTGRSFLVSNSGTGAGAAAGAGGGSDDETSSGTSVSAVVPTPPPVSASPSSGNSSEPLV